MNTVDFGYTSNSSKLIWNFQEDGDVTEKHKSSSIEDLMTLFEMEKDFARTLNDSFDLIKHDFDLVKAVAHYIAAIDYDT